MKLTISPPAPGCRTAHSQPYSAHEKNSVPADALSGAMAVDRGLRHRRLRTLPALSRDRALDGGAGMRCRLADHAVQDPPARDLPVSQFGIRRGRAYHRVPSRDPAVDCSAAGRADRGRIWDRALQYRLVGYRDRSAYFW